MATTLDTRNFTRRPAPVLPYITIAERVLPGWDISLVFVGETRARNLNRTLRDKDYVPNVLSYETGTKSGEIIICLPVAKKQAPSYDLSYRNFVAFLFIHGMLHLKGLRHGATMERRERDLLASFRSTSSLQTTNGTTHRNRNRYRNASHEGRRRRGD